MKHRILLFCVAFLLSIGVFAALWGTIYLLGDKDSTEASAQPETTQEQPATSAPKAPEQPADKPEVKEETTATETQDPEPEVKPDTPKTAKHKPATPEEKEEMARQVVNEVQEALKAEGPAEALERLVAENKVSEEAARNLLAWREKYKPAGVEYVGTFMREDGGELKRWRLKSAEGVEDMLLDVMVDDESARVEAATITSADKTKLAGVGDSLATAEAFVESVRLLQIDKARELIIGDDISYGTLVALCMIFEEDNLDLRKEKPIRNRFQFPERAGYIVYLAPKDGTRKNCNFGLEMGRADGMWKVAGVSFDSLLASYEARAAEQGYYSPIVPNPKGGDSLALYFGFDDATLTERSIQQLEIVAKILIRSNGRLDISGHTDDIGTDGYNKGLSERRAQAVKDALVQAGVPEDHISTTGMGKTRQRRTPSTARTLEEAELMRQENRRAEIYLDFVEPDAQ